MQPILYFIKSKRAQTKEDFETWLEGGAIPTLNAFDVGDGREVVLILDGTRVDDVRVYDDEIMQTVIQRWGTGGGNVPAIMFDDNEPVVMRDREGRAGGGKGPLTSTTAFTLSTSNFHTLFPSSSTVRRLTPTEYERLQGFPDGWTEGQADSSRYKQMGNAVAVPVVNWIISRMVEN